MQHYSVLSHRSVWCGWEQKWASPQFKYRIHCSLQAFSKAVELPHDCVCIEALSPSSIGVANQLLFSSISNAFRYHSRPASGSCTFSAERCLLLPFSLPRILSQRRIGFLLVEKIEKVENQHLLHSLSLQPSAPPPAPHQQFSPPTISAPRAITRNIIPTTSCARGALTCLAGESQGAEHTTAAFIALEYNCLASTLEGIIEKKSINPDFSP
jgi:hypothetical protein